MARSTYCTRAPRARHRALRGCARSSTRRPRARVEFGREIRWHVGFDADASFSVLRVAERAALAHTLDEAALLVGQRDVHLRPMRRGDRGEPLAQAVDALTGVRR